MENTVIKIPYIYDDTKFHTLTLTEVEDEYLFMPAESWMPLQLTYDDKDNIFAFDTDGMGQMRSRGDEMGGKKITDIRFVEGKGLIVTMKS